MTPFGEELRSWRKHRRYTQMDLAREAEVSTRHLSCVETGKARPSRVLVLPLAETLEVPLEATNRLLTLAGFAPAFRSQGLEGPEAYPVRTALDFLLRRHHPYPAVVVDSGWNAVVANDAYLAFGAWLASGEHRRAEATRVHDEPPLAGSNVLLPLFDPAGLRPLVRDFDRLAAHLLTHLRRSAREEPSAAKTLDDLLAMGAREHEPEPGATLPIVIPLVFEAHGLTLRLFTSMTMFGSSVDTVLSSLRLETFFAADDDTDRQLRRMFHAGPSTAPGSR